MDGMRAFGAILSALLLIGQVALRSDNFEQDGIPQVPADLRFKIGPYRVFQSCSLLGWDPRGSGIVITRPEGSTIQAARVVLVGTPPEFFTKFPSGVREYSMQPEGKYIVYRKDYNGNQQDQLYRYDIDTTESTLLSDGSSRNLYPCWSRSGKLLAYSTTRRNGKDMDIYVLNPADPKSERVLAKLDGEDWAVFDWSPDDKKIVISDYRSPNETYLWVMDVSSGHKQLLTPNERGEKAFNGSYAYFSADGKGVYISTDRGSEFRRLAYLDLATNHVRYLTSYLNWDVEEFKPSPDGRLLAFVSNEDGVGRIHLLDSKTLEERAVPSLPPGVPSELAWSDDSSRLGFVFSSTKGPGDIYSIVLGSERLDRWTYGYLAVNTAGFKDPQVIRWKSFDGRMISGFLYEPPDRFKGKRPVIIDIHGGPYSQARPDFRSDDNYFRESLGVAIIHPNIRGSSGYGKTFLRLDDGFLRDDANKDVGTLLDWIASQPNLDPDRVMLAGASHGGYVALSVAAEYPKRIRAVVSYVGITDLASFMERETTYEIEAWRREYGDTRDERMKQFLHRISPVSNAKKITAPVFMIVGKNDPLTSIEETKLIVNELRRQGTPAWYLEANMEGHGFTDPRNYEFMYLRKALFVEEFLMKPGPIEQSASKGP
jgi:dipeptidyl aminopeptidase/acylaminoacyl peptidase